MRKKVTSTDIAKKAGVSQATVSMVLNHKYNVSFSRETGEKSERIAKEMGYTIPKQRQRKESRKGNPINGLSLTHTNSYYFMLLQGI